MLAVARTECVRVHASSGTRGKPTVVAYTRGDIDVWAEVCARALMAAGAQRGDVVHNAYGYGLFTGGLGLHYGAERVGCTVVPASGGNTPRQVAAHHRLPGARPLLHAQLRAGHRRGVREQRHRPVRDVAGLRHLRRRAVDATRCATEIQQRLGIRALDIYGLSEVIGPGVASECEQQAGAHVNEDHFFPEVVDPESGQPLPDGEVGELVFTSLTREAMPLVRYRTGDLVSITREPCACGRTLARISRVVGRTDDMLIVRGVNLFPSEVEAALLEIDGLAPHYLLRLQRPGLLDVLTIEVETGRAPTATPMRSWPRRRTASTGARRRVRGQGAAARRRPALRGQGAARDRRARALGAVRTAVITGASSGIGLAVARLLARRGTLAPGHGGARTERLEREGARLGAEAVVCDVTVRRRRGRLVEAARDAGGCDLLVQCAGIPGRSDILSADLDVYRRVMETNYVGLVRVGTAFWPQLLERQGRLVNVVSVAGTVSLPGSAPYCAAKSAAIAYSRALVAAAGATASA